MDLQSYRKFACKKFLVPISLGEIIKLKPVILTALLALIPLWLFSKGATGIDKPAIQNKTPISAQFEDKSLFLSPIKRIHDSSSGNKVTGLTVPHHLLARDLIARAFHFASGGKYSQILILSPDHFNLGDTNISVSGRNFVTVFGELKTDFESVRRLQKLAFVHDGNFFYREHGIEAELPFVKYYFPDARIIALAIKATTPKSQLGQIVNNLKKILKPDSLIIQSTDFSHYLTPSQADEHDQQTVQVLNSANPENLFTLNQPSNLDSIAAQYIQMRLQNEFYGSKLHFLGHRNSQNYIKEKIKSSTSYIVQAYYKDSELTGNRNGTIIFVGDIMLSRTIGSIMEKRNYDYPFQKIAGFLQSADMVFGNLEGPISNRGTKGNGKYTFRDNPRVVTGLKNAGFNILSIANNHILDYGREAFIDTLTNLKNAEIAPLGGGANFHETHRGVFKNINGTRLIFLGYTDLLPHSTAASENSAGIGYLDIDQVKRDVKKAKAKADIVIVSFHWGHEYQTKQSQRQEQLARDSINAGASLVIGHHPHVVQPVENYGGGYIAYSLGNFVFDQNFSPDTKTGLVLQIVLGKKQILQFKQYKIAFTHTYQPYFK